MNPATDTAESTAEILKALEQIRTVNEIPTQLCVLSHVTVQMKALDLAAPMGLMFQSLSGSEAGNRAFGISVALILLVSLGIYTGVIKPHGIYG